MPNTRCKSKWPSSPPSHDISIMWLLSAGRRLLRLSLHITRPVRGTTPSSSLAIHSGYPSSYFDWPKGKYDCHGHFRCLLIMEHARYEDDEHLDDDPSPPPSQPIPTPPPPSTTAPMHSITLDDIYRTQSVQLNTIEETSKS
ncbi:hypothetical protein GOBAR_AA02087 [Gossypium barbadense]|uniref:Uncharacterized protein n=1 Tax=Gossypium barbadense TaxID=3634 RepID=A0A2P5YSE3_GOSBA|nr:hypothetical protein GOBAR_AA02087 [Gossypium barbadense]